jgi:hypothetical protein
MDYYSIRILYGTSTVVKQRGLKCRVQLDTGSPRARAGCGGGRICFGLASLSSATTTLGGSLVVCKRYFALGDILLVVLFDCLPALEQCALFISL